MKSKAIVMAVALFCLGIALAAFFAASGHATATVHDGNRGGGGDISLKSWDTDNLRYTVGDNSYTARTFGGTFYEYGGYLRTEPAKPCVEYRGNAGSVLRASYCDD